MRLLQYRDLDLRRFKPAFAKLRAAIEGGDFKSPDVKKLHSGNYYRASSTTATACFCSSRATMARRCAWLSR